MKAFRIFLIVLIVIIPVGSIHSAGTVESKPAKVVVWYETDLATSIEEINRLFVKKHPNITIEWAKQDPNQVTAKLALAMSGGVAPDIVLASQKRISPAEFQLGAWADLNDYAKDPEFAGILENLPQTHVNGYRNGDRLYGLPMFIRHVGLFVRESWMKEVGGSLPLDWEELTQLAKKFTIPGERVGFGIFGAPGATNSAGFTFMYAAPAAGIEYPIIDAEGKPSFGTDEAVEVARWIYRWQHIDKVTSRNTPQWTHTELYQAIQAGQVGIARVGGWNVPAWEKQEKIGSDFIVMDFPPLKQDQKEPNYQYTWNDGIAISRDSKSPEAAFTFFKFLFSKDIQGIFVKNLTSWARTDLDFDTLLGDNPRLRHFDKPTNFAPDMAWHPNFLPIMEILSKHINAMLSDSQIAPEKAMHDAYEEAMAAFNKL